MKVGIDLLWVNPGKNGGTESYIRNLLEGFKCFNNDIKFILFVSKDNYYSFEKYRSENIELKKCNINSSNVVKRLLWQNIFLDYTARKNKVDIMYIPVYSKPLITTRKLKYITVIHDLQAIHYPQYFTKLKRLSLKLLWYFAINTSYKIITISEFVKNDIVKNYRINEDKIYVIYNPVIIKDSKELEISECDELLKEDYYYTVSSLQPHKNIQTLLKVIKKIKDENLDLNKKLIITGVDGTHKKEINNKINEYGIKENVVLTGYISNDIKNCLYKNCDVFLFASIFEGFGMPPIEAMQFGAKVITTKRSSLLEVTKGKAIYVNDPFSIDEWIERLYESKKIIKKKVEFEEYKLNNVTKQYIKVFKDSV